MLALLIAIIAVGIFSSFSSFYILLHLFVTWFRTRSNARRKLALESLGKADRDATKTIGFFHPYCNAGGGGERVLWAAIKSIQTEEPDIVSVVYSGDVDATKDQIIAKVKSRFDITLNPSTLHFVFLQTRFWVDAGTWPRFTLLGQSLGSVALIYEGLSSFIPDLYIDSMGYAFTFPAVRVLGGIPVGAYVHYPTISTNMLARVKSRRAGHTNSDFISSSPLLSQGKLLYYRLFMYYYRLCLRSASFLMVNSSWTKNHIDSILAYQDLHLDLYHLLPPQIFMKLAFYLFAARSETPDNQPLAAKIVHPPCPTLEMSKFPLDRRQPILLSIAQFRPEKDHQTQLLAFAHLLKTHPEYVGEGVGAAKLVLIGGSRGDEDAARVVALQQMAKDLDIDKQTLFIVNAEYSVMLEWLSKASIGINTMIDEHFGISVVEVMAAGLIPVVHASGGPLEDIVTPYDGLPTGYHANDPITFASAFNDVLSLSLPEDLAMRLRARKSSERFSDERFIVSWNKALGGTWQEWLR